MSDFIGHGGFLIEGRLEPISEKVNTLPNLFTCNEEWVSIDIKELMSCMRHVYENQESLNAMKEKA